MLSYPLDRETTARRTQPRGRRLAPSLADFPLLYRNLTLRFAALERGEPL